MPKIVEISIRWLVMGVFALFVACTRVSGPEVLVLYFNETSPTKAERANYLQILSWLDSDDSSASKKMAEVLRTDLREYPTVVAKEIADIKSAITSINTDFRVVLFTNKLARDGKFIVWQNKHTPNEMEYRIKVIKADHAIIDSNPLADERFLSIALGTVSDMFAGPDHRFMLLVKTHGTEKLALMPRLRVLAKDTSRDEIVRLAGSLGSEKKLDLRLPGRAEEIGISKELFFWTLAGFAERGLAFEWVFMEACYGGLSGNYENWQLPGNVKALYANIGQSTKYSNLNYSRLLAGISPGKAISQVIKEELDRTFFRIEPSDNRLLGIISISLALLLLAILVTVQLTRRRFRRAAGERGTAPTLEPGPALGSSR